MFSLRLWLSLPRARNLLPRGIPRAVLLNKGGLSRGIAESLVFFAICDLGVGFKLAAAARSQKIEAAFPNIYAGGSDVSTARAVFESALLPVIRGFGFPSCP